jgi:mono/diheme cytochrome c family protein
MKLLTGMILLVFLAACGRGYPEREPPANFLENAQNQLQGKNLFVHNCVYCHGTVAEGRTPRASSYVPRPADLQHPKYRTLDPAYLFWRIQNGKNVEPYRSRGSVMPAYGPHFSDEQIWQLVAFIRSRPVAPAGR